MSDEVIPNVSVSIIMFIYTRRSCPSWNKIRKEN